MMKSACLFFVIIMGLSYSSVMSGNVVLNGGFETALVDHSRPEYWYLGFSDSPQSYLALGKWSLDSSIKQEGEYSLKLEPASKDGFLVSQILHAPVYDLTGKTVRVSADIRHAGLTEPPVIMVLAVNPTLVPDPDFGIGIAGKAIFAATGPEGSFATYQAQFTATAPAAYLFIVCSVSGYTGAAWFDRIVVDMDPYQPGPDPEPVASPLQQHNFKMGFVQENPIDLSEKAMESLIGRVALTAEVINLFFHVRWCQLTGESIDWGHRLQLRQAGLAQQAGLKIALTFDFTHNDPNSVGHINPTPDGAAVGSLNNPSVSTAYKNELLDLCERVRPEYVIVGVEADIFHDNHPEQWAAYVAMFKSVADTLTSRYPGIHVTAYFTLPWMVNVNGAINWTHANVWRGLLPQLQSVAYSTYPEVLGLKGVTLAPGYFTRAGEIAPDLPLMLPEFGLPGAADVLLNFDQQADFLSRIFSELATAQVEFATWFSMYDQTYMGVPDVFREAFWCLGMHTFDGTPKKAWAVWNAVFQTGTAIEHEKNELPFRSADFTLLPNYPNPFNPVTNIPYQINETTFVTLAVYDMTGRRVRVLVNDHQSPGNRTIQWNGTDESGMAVAAGIYMVALQTGQRVEWKKIALIK